MKTLIIAILILVVFPLEIVACLCSLTLYLFIMAEYDGLLTKQLIDKL